MKLLLIGLAALMALAVPVGLSLADTPSAAATSDPSPAASSSASRGGAAETFAHTQSIDAAVVAPYPTCPLSCSLGYGVIDEGLVFPVRENATRVVVTATWSPSTPASETLEVSLSRQDPDCGEGCYRGLAEERGARSVTFELDAPEPGDHMVWAWPVGPAGAALRQDVHLEVAVHYS